MERTPGFMEIDLSRMLESPKCAIHIPTKSDAILVLQNARRQFHDRVVNWPAEGYWDDYKEKTAYTLFFRDADAPSTLSYGRMPWFLENGYEVIEIPDLIASNIDIDESDCSIEELIGVVV